MIHYCIKLHNYQTVSLCYILYVINLHFIIQQIIVTVSKYSHIALDVCHPMIHTGCNVFSAIYIVL